MAWGKTTKQRRAAQRRKRLQRHHRNGTFWWCEYRPTPPGFDIKAAMLRAWEFLKAEEEKEAAEHRNISG